MYAAGNMPDHVTRYNHKCESRWLVPPREPRYFSWGSVMTTVGLMFSCGGLITAAVFALRMM